MNDRFIVKGIYICPFIFTNEINVVPNFVDYPMRPCVIDKEKNIAIDIELEKKYDVLETVSRLYLLSKYEDKISNEKRVGIDSIGNINISKKLIKKSSKIIQNLQNNYDYEDGNIIDNLNYLRLVSDAEDKAKIKKKQFK